MSTAFQHQASGSVYVMVIDGTGTGLDLTTISAGHFDVRKPSGETVSWTLALSEQSVDSVTLTHTLVTGDLNLTGDYRIIAKTTGSFSGEIWSKDATLNVVPS